MARGRKRIIRVDETDSDESKPATSDKTKESSPQDNDYAKHPKFHKFKSTENKEQN